MSDRGPRQPRARARVILVAVFAVGIALPAGLVALSAPASSTSAASPQGTRIAAENALPGTDSWNNLGNYDIDELAAFAGRTSVGAGETIAAHARGSGTSLTAVLYRLGYYQDHGGRAIATYGPVPLLPQPDCSREASTGLVACPWAPTLVVATRPDWVSGVYLLRLDSDNGYRFFVHFVVRGDEDGAAIAVSIEFKTNQAYNDYGGESLYVSRHGEGRRRAYRVSFDRPYATGAGTGTFFTHDVDMVRWLEASGYDVTYVSDVDRAINRRLLLHRRVLLDVGHDEYWTWVERDNVEAALAAGVNLLFASGNESFWNVRLDNSPVGAERIITSYKEAALDPVREPPGVTVAFAEPPLNRPENALVGLGNQSHYDDRRYGAPWVVSAAPDRWYFDCTGLRPGDRVNNIVGEEWGAVQTDRRTPDRLEVVAHGIVYNDEGVPYPHDSIIYTTPRGAQVFAAGSIFWSWGLMDHASRQPPISPPSFQQGYDSNAADRRIEQLMANLLDRFAGSWDGQPRPCGAAGQAFYDIGPRPTRTPRPVPPTATALVPTATQPVVAATALAPVATATAAVRVAQVQPQRGTAVPRSPVSPNTAKPDGARERANGVWLVAVAFADGIAVFGVLVWAIRRHSGRAGRRATGRRT